MRKLDIFKKANQVRQSVQAEATDKLQSTYVSLMNAARKVVQEREAIVNSGTSEGVRKGWESRQHKQTGGDFTKYANKASKAAWQLESQGRTSVPEHRDIVQAHRDARSAHKEAESYHDNFGDKSKAQYHKTTSLAHLDHLRELKSQEPPAYRNSNDQFTNPDGTFKIVNGIQLNAAIALFVSKGHSEESATRLANSISNPNGNGAADIGSYGAVGPTDNPPKDGEKELPGEKEGVKEACCKADKASEAAERDNTPESHETAHNAHQEAAATATKFGDADKASKHTAKATEHKGKAQTQREAAPQVA